MKLREIIAPIEQLAPRSFQEGYDNTGLLTGNPNQEVEAALLTIDTTEAVVEEAIKKNAQLIISHHPILFGGLKSLTGKNYIERTIIKALRNEIAIYAAHTNLDAVQGGVNTKIAEKMGLQNCQILLPRRGELQKLVVFVPEKHTAQVREAIFAAGAGHIGQYDACSFNSAGKGSFRASEKANPFVGQKGEVHFEDETRVETIFPKHKTNTILNALFAAHPYEEVAYDIYPLENTYPKAGAGMVGNLPEPMPEKKFLHFLKETFNARGIRYTTLRNQPVRKVAFCGGAGNFLLPQALATQADAFVSADFKYHQFFDADGKILIADIGHFESEQFTKIIFYDLLTKKIPNFALHLSETKTNPINYL